MRGGVAAGAGAAVLAAGVLAAGCTVSGPADRPSAQGSPSPTVTASPTVLPTGPSTSPPGPAGTSLTPAPTTVAPTGTPASPPVEATGPPRFRAGAAMADVRLLAGRIGPRLATSPAFRRAGRVVERRLEDLGYAVRRAWFPVPAGDSWGVPVEAGRSFNLVAEPPGFDPTRRFVVVGAHLDTVAAAPGAEDNASGVAVLLELARLAATHDTRLPTVFIAFGAEEPRGSGDDMHHFGSQHHVAGLPAPRRHALEAMVAIDRVGVGTVVPVCTGPLSPPRVQRALLRAAAHVDVPAQPCENTASDHWSYEKAGHPVARLGSTSYAAYHSPADRPAVVSTAQLRRTGQVAWAWLNG